MSYAQTGIPALLDIAGDEEGESGCRVNPLSVADH